MILLVDALPSFLSYSQVMDHLYFGILKEAVKHFLAELVRVPLGEVYLSVYVYGMYPR